MKNFKKNLQYIFSKDYSGSKNLVVEKVKKTFYSSWIIGAVLGALSAWTAGILYV